MPPTPQIAMKKKAQPARKMVSMIVAHEARRPVERAQHRDADRRAFQHAAGHQREDRKPGQQFEVRDRGRFPGRPAGRRRYRRRTI